VETEAEGVARLHGLVRGLEISGHAGGNNPGGLVDLKVDEARKEEGLFPCGWVLFDR
jgi:hypothetical protein